MYAPGATPRSFGDVMTELRKISADSKNPLVDSLNMKIHNVAPSKPQDPSLWFADGTNWNPGSGRGVYIYTSGAYTKL